MSTFAFDVIENSAGNTYAARLGQSLETRGDVHPVTIDIVTLDDHVAQVDADAQVDPPASRYIGIALGHTLLGLHRTFHGGDDTSELS